MQPLFLKKQGVSAWNVRTLHLLVTSRLVKDKLLNTAASPGYFCSARADQLGCAGIVIHHIWPDLVIYCTHLMLSPDTCKIALSCPAASLSHDIADLLGYSGKRGSPIFLRQVLVICTTLHIHHLFIGKIFNHLQKNKTWRTKEMCEKRCMTI